MGNRGGKVQRVNKERGKRGEKKRKKKKECVIIFGENRLTASRLSAHGHSLLEPIRIAHHLKSTTFLMI